VTDQTKPAKSLNDLDPKEYIEVLKNTLEVPKYLVSLTVFFATATGAISRLKSGPVSTLEKWIFVLAMGLTFFAMLSGFRVVSHVLSEMTNPYNDDARPRTARFEDLRRGPYSQFVKWTLVPIVAWMLCLIAMVAT